MYCEIKIKKYAKFYLKQERKKACPRADLLRYYRA